MATITSTFVIEDRSQKALSQISRNIDELEKKLKKLTINEQTGNLRGGQFAHYYQSLTGISSKLKEKLEELNTSYTNGSIGIEELEGKFGALSEVLKEQVDSIFDLNTINDLLNQRHKVTAKNLISLHDIMSKTINKENEMIKSEKQHELELKILDEQQRKELENLKKLSKRAIDDKFSDYYERLSIVAYNYNKELENLNLTYTNGEIKIDEFENSFKSLNEVYTEQLNKVISLENINKLVNEGYATKGKRLKSVYNEVDKLTKKEGKFIDKEKESIETQERLKLTFKSFSSIKNLFSSITSAISEMSVSAGIAIGAVVLAFKTAFNTITGIFKKFHISLSQMVGYTKTLFGKVKDMVNDTSDLYVEQRSVEQRLASSLRHRFSATDEEVQGVINLAKGLSEVGIYSDKYIMKGFDRLALYAKETSDITRLGKAYIDLLAARHGLDATDSNAVNIADAFGRAFQGNFQNISRTTGVVFSKLEREFLETASHSERIEFLFKRLVDVGGDMNRVLGENKTSEVQKLSNQLEDMKESVGEFTNRIKRVFSVIKNEILLKIYNKVKEVFEYATKNSDEVIRKLKALAGVAISIAGVIASAFILANAPLVFMIGTVLSLTDAWSSMEDGGTSAIKGILSALDEAITKIYNGIIGLVNRIHNALISNKYVQKFLGLEVVEAEKGDSLLKYLSGSINSNFYKALADMGGSGFASRIRNAYLAWSENGFKAGGLGEFLNSRDIELLRRSYEDVILDDLNNGDNLVRYKDIFTGETKYYGADLGLKQIENQHILTNAFDWVGKSIDKYFPDLITKVSDFYDKLGEIGLDVDVITDSVVDLSDDWRDTLTKRAQERFNLYYRNLTPTVNINVEANNQRFDAFDLSKAISKEFSEAISNVSGSSLSGHTTSGQAVAPIGNTFI